MVRYRYLEELIPFKLIRNQACPCLLILRLKLRRTRKEQNPMKFKQLGRSGLLVSDLSLGTMIFGEESERGTSAAEAEHMIHHFLDAGGNCLDTADVFVFSGTAATESYALSRHGAHPPAAPAAAVGSV